MEKNILIVFLLIISFVLVFMFIRTRRKLMRFYYRYLYRGYPQPWPIKQISVENISPKFGAGKYGSKLESEIYFLGGDFNAGISGRERWILSVLAKEANKIFEFGTCTGATTYLLARNSPENAKVVTLTLHPEQKMDAISTKKDIAKDMDAAKSESLYTNFFYEGTRVEDKITQIFSDSKKLDVSSYVEQFDLIFIDGAHIYSYVLNDTEKALKMLKPGGILLWHDYRHPRRVPGVFNALNEIAEKFPLAHIEGTTLVFYRKPI